MSLDCSLLARDFCVAPVETVLTLGHREKVPQCWALSWQSQDTQWEGAAVDRLPTTLIAHDKDIAQIGTYVSVAYKRVVNDVTYTFKTTDTTYKRLRSLNGSTLSVSKPFGGYRFPFAHC